MEVFKIEKNAPDFDVFLSQIEVKPGSILVLRAIAEEISTDYIERVADQFMEFSKNDERFEGVRLFIIPRAVDLSELTDIELEEMGLMRIPEKKKKGVVK